MTNNEFHLMLEVARLQGMLEGMGKTGVVSGIYEALEEAFGDELLEDQLKER